MFSPNLDGTSFTTASTRRRLASAEVLTNKPLQRTAVRAAAEQPQRYPELPHSLDSPT